VGSISIKRASVLAATVVHNGFVCSIDLSAGAFFQPRNPFLEIKSLDRRFVVARETVCGFPADGFRFSCSLVILPVPRQRASRATIHPASGAVKQVKPSPSAGTGRMESAHRLVPRSSPTTTRSHSPRL
jgi:hypothetical protein